MLDSLSELVGLGPLVVLTVGSSSLVSTISSEPHRELDCEANLK